MSEKILCFIPCCKQKDPSGCNHQASSLWIEGMDTMPRMNLFKGREIRKSDIYTSSPLTDALSLYTGNFYRNQILNKNRIREKIRSGDLRLFIISAGYGVVESSECIHDYNIEMGGQVARDWKAFGLIDIISEITLKYKPEKVFGFFAGEKEWNGPGKKYRYFYSEGVKKALTHGLNVTEAGCFYRAEGRGVASILSLFGMCFMDAATSKFSDDFVETVIEKGFRNDHYPTALVKFDRFPGVKR